MFISSHVKNAWTMAEYFLIYPLYSGKVKYIALVGVLTFQPYNAITSIDKNVKNYTSIFTKSWGIF